MGAANKFTEQEQREIYEDYMSRRVTYMDLGFQYGCHWATIRKAVMRGKYDDRQKQLETTNVE